MKILHVIRSLDPADGGPPNVAASLAAAQAANGHTAAILGNQAGVEPEPLKRSLSAFPGFDRVHLYAADSSADSEDSAGAQQEIKRVADLKQLVSGFDVVHIHAIWDPILIRLGRVARQVGVPYVISPHGMLDRWSLRQRRLKKSVALALFVRRHLRRAAGLHALSPLEERELQRLSLGTQIGQIPNGVFLEQIKPAEAEASSPQIVFMSRLHYKKGLDHLAEAFRLVQQQVPEARLDVLGPDQGAQQQFEAEIERSGVADRVRLLGPIFGNDKLDYLRQATCFCLPSRQEGFSIAILEALACGRPVVVSEACNFPEVASAGAGYVLPLDPQQFAEHLIELLTQPSQAHQMGLRARRLVEEHYSWQQISTRITSFYQQCM